MKKTAAGVFSYREVLQWGTSVLMTQKIQDAAVDAWLLLEYVTGIDRTHYFLKMQEICPDEMETGTGS